MREPDEVFDRTDLLFPGKLAEVANGLGYGVPMPMETDAIRHWVVTALAEMKLEGKIACVMFRRAFAVWKNPAPSELRILAAVQEVAAAIDCASTHMMQDGIEYPEKLEDGKQ